MRPILAFIAPVFSLALAVFFAPVPAQASVTFTPVRVNIDGDPGEIVSATVRVTNDSAEPTMLRPTVQDFTSTDNNERGVPNFDVPANYGYGIKEWVTFGIKEKLMAPGESLELPFTVRIPSSASAGGHYGAILFDAKPRTDLLDPATSAVGVTGLAGPLVILRVNGDVLEDGVVMEFGRDKAWYSSLPVGFFVRFKAAGTVHLQPKGVISVRNLFGHEVTQLPVNVEEGNVLPGTIRRFDVPWVWHALPSDAGEFLREWKNFALGPYWAKLRLQYGTGNTTVQATQVVWVIPWLLILFLIALLVLLRIALHFYTQRAIAEHEKKKNPAA